MEDTKKLIEKYKRELMELSRTAAHENPSPARAPQIIGYVENMDEKSFSEAAQAHADECRGECGDAALPTPDGDYPPPEPRVESEPELPYHHEPEIPPPDYSNPPTAAEIDAVDLERTRENLLSAPASGSASIPMPTPSPSAQSVPMPAPSPAAQSVPIPRADPAPAETPIPPQVSAPLPEIINEVPSGGPDDRTEEYEPPYEDPLMAQNVPGAASVAEEQERGSQSAPRVFPEPRYSSYEDFRSKNTGRGTIIFRVTTAREALPVENAKCVITKRFGGIVTEIDTLISNESGQTPPRILPAPPKALSLQYDNLIQPFSLYDATVSREGYVDVVLTDIPVFDGVQSVQSVSMLPVAAERRFENISEVNPNAR